jgi:hypothetical protein
VTIREVFLVLCEFLADYLSHVLLSEEDVEKELDNDTLQAD